MKLLIVTFSLAIGIVHCADRGLDKLPAAEKEYLVRLERQEAREINCLNRLDAILTSKWTTEEAKISTRDLGHVPIGYMPEARDHLPSKRLYDSLLEEWVMENGSPARTVETCMRETLARLESLLGESDVKCLNELFESHVVEEQRLEKEFVDRLKDASKEDLPFRRFFSLRELASMMSNDRQIVDLLTREKRVLNEMGSYLSTEEDKDRKIFILQSECDWKRVAALREAANPEAKLDEFEIQVRELLNLLLGSTLIPTERSGPLNLKLILQKHEKWLGARQIVESRLKAEVKNLRSGHRDAEWLCEYARDLAFDLAEMQTSILTVPGNAEFSSNVWEIARRTRSLKLYLEKQNDIRFPSMNELATRVERDSRCFEAFSQMVKNHQRKAIVSSFLDSPFSIQELSCGPRWIFRGIITIRICHCVGSFCVSKSDLSGLGSTDYEMLREDNGVYRIIPSPMLVETVKTERASTAGDSSQETKR